VASALTTVRLLLVVPFAFLMLRAEPSQAPLTGILLVLAILTDLLDGPLARRRGTTSAGGAVYDHTTDFLFVNGGLAAGAARGVVPWILPVLVAVAFVQYVADSYWLHAGRRLRTSRLGRYNGVLYFLPLAGDIVVGLGFPVVRSLVTVLAWGLVATTVLSIVERLVLAWARRDRLPGRVTDA